MRKPATEKRTILITGGAGFIGSNFIHYLALERPDWHIVNLDKLTYAGSLDNLDGLNPDFQYDFIQGDITDGGLLNRLHRRYHFDGIVHFAAESHVDNSIASPETFVMSNVMGTFTLLEAARKWWMPKGRSACQGRFMHISTDDVFGELGKTGVFSETSPYRPNSPYSASKAGSDHLVRSYVKTYGMDCITTNCSNNYGPRQHREKFIPTVINTAMTGKEIPIYGDGSNIRDWLFVKDHCEALLGIFEYSDPGEHYLIGANNEQNNLDLARLICQKLDEIVPSLGGKSYTDQIRFVEDRPGHDIRYAVDHSKLTGELGWKPVTTFESGLTETIHWYIGKLNKKL